MKSSWKDFIVSDHYRVKNDFYDSLVAKHPRRTCEALWKTNEESGWDVEANPVPKNMSLEELWDWYKPLVEEEKLGLLGACEAFPTQTS